MNKSVLNIISFLHMLLIMFVVGVPIFSNDIFLLLIHLWIVPFILLHWYLNDNNCALSMIEKKLRERIYGKEHDIYEEDCITCKIVEPVYDFHKKMEQYNLRGALCIITILLWLITVVSINEKYKNGEISQLLKQLKIIMNS